jgi:ribosomal protein L11 methyltransferase
MDYIQLHCKITSENLTLCQEIVMQELADMDFESFEEVPDGIMAYIPETLFDQKKILDHQFLADFNFGKVDISYIKINAQNWNALWEKNFQPVLIAGKCHIRAPFHERNLEVPYEILIEPKMAFGTGHHETTSLMIGMMLSMDMAGKRILDMGCGTGVLGIMASKLNAAEIVAIDIDEWAYHNTIENAKVNHIHNINAELGGVDKISGHKFDLILANINRNILINQLSSYSQCLSAGGMLLMSGIFNQDFEMIKEIAETNGFSFRQKNEKNKWIAVLFVKN